jgi:hypothetical protein
MLEGFRHRRVGRRTRRISIDRVADDPHFDRRSVLIDARHHEIFVAV